MCIASGRAKELYRVLSQGEGATVGQASQVAEKVAQPSAAAELCGFRQFRTSTPHLRSSNPHSSAAADGCATRNPARETQSSFAWDSSICVRRTSRGCTRSAGTGSERRIPIPWAIARLARNPLCCPSAGSREGVDRSPHRMDPPFFARSSGGEPKHSRNRMPRRSASRARKGFGSTACA